MGEYPGRSRVAPALVDAPGRPGQTLLRSSVIRVVGVSCVRNEIDIIEPFVRHTSAAVDAHLIIHHASTDGTRDVLAALVAEGLPLVVIERETRVGFPQANWTNELAELAVTKHGADWVFPVDADEFLVWPSGAAAFEGLTSLHSVFWKTHVPDPSDDVEERNPVVRIRHRLAREAQVWRKHIVPAELVKGGGRLGVGNHSFAVNGFDLMSLRLPDRALVHMPARSARQLARKVAFGWLQSLLLHGGLGIHGRHRRELFVELRDHPDRFHAHWLDHARRFSSVDAEGSRELTLDPVEYRGTPLRYTPGPDQEVSALSDVLAWAEEAAVSLYLRSASP